MALRRGSHSVYDTQYHLVWAPKYRKKILTGAVGQRMKELLEEIADAYDISIEEMEVSQDHVHIFCSFPPRLSITQVVTRFKSLSARAIFREHPQVKKQLWGGEGGKMATLPEPSATKLPPKSLRNIFSIIVKTKKIHNSICSNLCR